VCSPTVVCRGSRKGKGLQEDDYLCGPSALQRAFRQYGVRLSQARIEEACGIEGDEGAGDEEIHRGILHFGFTFDNYETDIWNEGMSWVDDCITRGQPILLCVDDWSHWVCVYGALGSRGTMRYNVFDPGRFDWNLAEFGHNMYTSKSLVRRWRCSKGAREEAEMSDSCAYGGIAIYDRSRDV